MSLRNPSIHDEYEAYTDERGKRIVVSGSITLRDIFAGLALAGLLTQPKLFEDADWNPCEDSYAVADVMLSIRGQEQEDTHANL